jgi:hypothetical protein
MDDAIIASVNYKPDTGHLKQTYTTILHKYWDGFVIPFHPDDVKFIYEASPRRLRS